MKNRFDWHNTGRMFVFCVAVGCISGLVTAGIYSVFQEVRSAVNSIYPAVGIIMPKADNPAGQTQPLAHWENNERVDTIGELTLPRYWILIPLIPAAGGLICGFLIWSFAPESAGDGTDHIIKAFHFRNGLLRNRVPLTKTITSVFTLGTGGSAGWEGTGTLLGAWVSSSLSYGAQLNVRDRRTLLLAGAAGAIGGIFQIPVGGAFFIIEVLYASTALELSAILPCILSSIVGYASFRTIHGEIRPIDLPGTVGIHSPMDSLMFLLFIPILAVLGVLFVRVIMELRNRWFRRIRIPDLFKPAVGGFLLGCIALFCPQVLGGGYEWLPPLIHGTLPLALVGLFIFPKMLATAFTVSSGGSGGLFAPSIVIGGFIGGTLGSLCPLMYQHLGLITAPPDYTMCVLVGMSVFYAGIAKCPLAAAVIVCEVAGFHYELLLPLVALNLIHIALQSPSTSLYEEQVMSEVDSEAHFGHYSIDLLQTLTVGDAQEHRLWRDEPKNVVLEAGLSIKAAVRIIVPLPDTLFPVLYNGKYIGIVLAEDILSEFQHQTAGRSKTIQDLTQTAAVTATPETDLYTALRLMVSENVPDLPVLIMSGQSSVSVDRNSIYPVEYELFGMLHRSDIMAVYNQRLATASERLYNSCLCHQE